MKFTKPFSLPYETIRIHTEQLGRANGFDLLRLSLAIAIVCYHSFTITHGSIKGMPFVLQTAARMILPSFFALSGYLVAGSLSRCVCVQEFLLLRLLRVLPGLIVVIAMCALALGPSLTSDSFHEYFHDPKFLTYFQNIWAQPRFYLPGLFSTNPRAGVVNGSLWTIQLEIGCYLSLAVVAVLSRSNWSAIVLMLVICVLLFPPHLIAQRLPAQGLLLAFAAGALLFRVSPIIPHHPAIGLVCLAAAYILARDWRLLTFASLPLAYAVVWLGSRRIPTWVTRSDYSYGTYLTAYPLEQTWIHLCPHLPLWWLDLLFALPLTVFCAYLLWHGVEKPILRRKHEIVARLLAGTAISDRPW